MSTPASSRQARLLDDDVVVETGAAPGVFARRVGWAIPRVDEWGRDDRLAGLVGRLARWRWNVVVSGTEHLPSGGALVVVSTRRLAMTPVMAACALADATDRPVRFVGRPDVAPVGALLQRAGALLNVASDIATALANGELIVAGAEPGRGNSIGAVDPALIAAALAARARIVPAAAHSEPLARDARLTLVAPVHPTRIRRGHLAELELADAVHARLQQMTAGGV